MKKVKAFLTVLTAVWLAGAASATTFAEVVYYNSDYYDEDDEDDDDEKSKDKESNDKEQASALSAVKKLLEAGKMTVEEIKDLGPGYEAALDAYAKTNQIGAQGNLDEDTDSFDGPVVTKVTLSQTYHEDYETYEFSMANEYFFYANIGNGELTDQSVTIDIPTNLTYTVEKDGLPYAYQSKQSISARGTYVVKLMAVENQDAPLSEQKEYQAVFRFRIQEKPKTADKEGLSDAVLSGSGASLWDSSEKEEQPEESSDYWDEEDLEPETEPDPESEAGFESESEETGEPETGWEPSMLTERTQHFDAERGNYVITLENGKELTSSLPEGYIGSGTLSLRVSELDEAETKLYKNDEQVDFVNDNPISETGHYRVDVNGSSCYFTLAEAVRQMEYYPAPAGMKFAEAYRNEEELELPSDRYAVMEEDGDYTFVLSGDGGNRLEVALRKDTMAPQVAVTVSKHSASIEYLSDDIQVIQLVKDGKEIAGFVGSSVTDPGKYTLLVADAAGNQSVTGFSLSYHINLYGVFAILLVILTIAGIGFFAVYIKKHTKVR